jgi:hypothetical protein
LEKILLIKAENAGHGKALVKFPNAEQQNLSHF